MPLRLPGWWLWTRSRSTPRPPPPALQRLSEAPPSSALGLLDFGLAPRLGLGFGLLRCLRRQPRDVGIVTFGRRARLSLGVEGAQHVHVDLRRAADDLALDRAAQGP